MVWFLLQGVRTYDEFNRVLAAAPGEHTSFADVKDKVPRFADAIPAARYDQVRMHSTRVTSVIIY